MGHAGATARCTRCPSSCSPSQLLLYMINILPIELQPYSPAHDNLRSTTGRPEGHPHNCSPTWVMMCSKSS